MKVRIAIFLAVLSLLPFAGCRADAGPVAAALPPAAIPPDARLVGLFFDDGFQNQYDAALPVLQQYGFRATFAIITGSIGKGHDLYRYMDKTHIKALAGCGMNIASHTVSHVSLASGLTDKQLHREVFDSKQTLEDMVYPYYEWDERAVDSVMEAGYTCARAGWNREKAYRLSTGDPRSRYHAFSWQITDEDMDTFKQYLAEAGPDALVGLTYHFIADNGPATTSTPVANFEAQMAYLHDAGFTVVPLPQLFE
jgi:peptidoglycan/xylan/chitin deacetylase (PgdA/CDA1 family)